MKMKLNAANESSTPEAHTPAGMSTVSATPAVCVCVCFMYSQCVCVCVCVKIIRRRK